MLSMLIGDKKFMLQAKDNNNHIHKLTEHLISFSTLTIKVNMLYILCNAYYARPSKFEK